MAREYYFLRALCNCAQVDYTYFAEPTPQQPSGAELPDCRNACHAVMAVPKPPAYSTRQKIRGALGKWPLPILNYMSPLMIDAVRKLLHANRYDMIHVEGIHMVRYLQGVDIPRVYNWHNIESEAIRRFADSVESRTKSWYAHITADKMERLEHQILSKDFGHVVCSERERKQLLVVEPRATIAVVENGVDAERFARSPTSTQDKLRDLVFVGNMNYYPNIEAAVSFATNIWPSVRSRMKELRLVIVGANPATAVKNLSNTPGITVTGTVPDVRPFYENALAAIVPLRLGGGTRLKILEAMAAGVPVISTPLGAEGLDVIANTNILIAHPDDEASWVNPISELLATRELGASLADKALQLIKARYDWEILGQKLSQTYRAWGLNDMV